MPEISRLTVVVDSDTHAAEDGLRKIHESVNGLGQHFQASAVAGVAFGAGLAAVNVAAQAATGLLRGVVGGASDLNESMNKVDVVFGAAAGSVKEFASHAAQALGQSTQQALEATGTFGNLFVSMGLGQGPAAQLSTQIVTLASDLASFNNIDPAEALEKLRSGLVGESEPLRTLGVNLNEAAVAQEGMRLGLAKTAAALTDADKVQARYSLILAQTKTAQGDFANTSTGLANAQRIISASFTDIQTQIGSKLLPVIAPLVSAFAQALPAAFAAVTPALDAVGRVLAGVGDGLRPLTERITTFWGSLAGGQTLATTVNRALGDLIPHGLNAVLDAIDGAFRAVKDTLGGLIQVVQQFVGNRLDSSLQALAGIALTVSELFQGDFKGAFLIAKATVNNFIDDLQRDFGPIADTIGNAIATVAPLILAKAQEWGRALVEWVGPQIGPLLGALGDLAGQFLAWVGAQAGPILAALQAWAQSFVAWVVPAGMQFLQEWPGILNSFLDWIEANAPTILGKLATWALQFAAWVVPAIPPMLVALAEVAAAIVVFLAETLVVIGLRLAKWGLAFVEWVGANVLPELPGALGAILEAVVGFIGDAAGTVAKEAGKIGQAILDGIGGAIDSGIGALRAKFTAFANSLPQWARDALGIKSPSAVFADVGTAIVDGLVAGIDAGAGRAAEAAQRLVGGVTKMAAQVVNPATWNPDPNVWSYAQLVAAGLQDPFATHDRIGDHQVGYDQASDVARGLTDGMRDATSAVSDAASAMGQAAIDALASSTGSQSPSTYAAAIGKDIADGLYAGLYPGMPHAFADAFRDLPVVFRRSADALRPLVQGFIDTYARDLSNWNSPQHARELANTIRDYTDTYLTEIGKMADKVVPAVQKVQDDLQKALSDAVGQATKAAVAAVQQASDQIGQAIAALAESRDLRGRRAAFDVGQQAEARGRSVQREDAEAVYQYNVTLRKQEDDTVRQLQAATTDAQRAAIKAQAEERLRQLNQQYAEQNAAREHRRQLAEEDQQFADQQARERQAFEDKLADEQLAKQIARITTEKNARLAAIQEELIAREKAAVASAQDAIGKIVGKTIDDINVTVGHFFDSLGDEMKKRGGPTDPGFLGRVRGDVSGIIVPILSMLQSVLGNFGGINPGDPNNMLLPTRFPWPDLRYRDPIDEAPYTPRPPEGFWDPASGFWTPGSQQVNLNVNGQFYGSLEDLARALGPELARLSGV